MNKSEIKIWLTGRLAEMAGLPATVIDPTQPFSSFGLDSVKLSALAAEAEQRLGRAVNPTELFEHPTIEMLAAYFAQETSTPQRATAAMNEPIAITGIACRFPKAPDKDSFWHLLENGVDAITETPADRWDVGKLYSPDPKTAGHTASKWGGYLNDVASFDARFFHVSSDEATRMDPQQRLLLELCWEAMEDAGEIPARLRGSVTGVFVGISGSEYIHRQLRHRDGIGPYTVSGNSPAMAANRLSYMFDLHGPSLSVDTACSSSLVAVHLACRALVTGECEMAIVAGVNMLLDPEITIGLSKAAMLAPDGRCKPFDARANGYVRGEGAGVVVLKPLSAARAARDRIYTVIRGSAVNQDGSTNGLTAPNPAAQREVLRSACQRAGVRTQDIQYVECHGTGTFLGDPIEARSLGAVLGKDRSDSQPCYIGSVKSNIGHLEAAAGIAALIKTSLALHHKKVPPSIHFAQANPHIAFDELKLKVVDRAMNWPQTSESLLAGISSFGFGGTNAHLVLESAAEPEEPAHPRHPMVLPISAVSRPSLLALVHAWRERLDAAPENEIAALAQAACLRRTHHRPFRVVAVATEPAAMRQRLAELEERLDQVLAGVRAVPAGAPRIAFVFSGQGSQFAGMGRSLLKNNSLFRTLIRSYDTLVKEDLGWSLETTLRGENNLSGDDSAIAQPLLLALQLALVKLWAAHGIEPAAVVGHSAGEIAAAVTAGILNVREAFHLASRRGQLMNLVTAGRMLAVGLSRQEASGWIESSSGISLAVVNGPSACVLSGNPDGLAEIEKKLAGERIPSQWLPVRYAFHSVCMEPVQDALKNEFSGLVPQAGAVPMYSTVLGRKVAPEELTAEYWGRGARDIVEFAAAMKDLLQEGVDAIIEIGPQPVLHSPLRQLAARDPQRRIPVLPSMEKDRDERSTLLESLSILYRIGCSVRWTQLFPAPVRMQSLPAYGWDHERFWLERKEPESPKAAPFLLGQRVTTTEQPQQNFIWENVLSSELYPHFLDHRIAGQVVFPATGFIELITAAALQCGISAPLRIEGLTLHRTLPITEVEIRVRTELVPTATPGSFAVTISSAAETPGEKQWIQNSTGVVSSGPSAQPPGPVENVSAFSPIPAEQFYAMMKSQGFEYGNAFQKLNGVWRIDGEAIANLDHSQNPESGPERIALMDASLQLLAAAVPSDAVHSGSMLLPYSAALLTIQPGPAVFAKAHARVRLAEGGEVLGDVVISNEHGQPCVQILGVRLRQSHRGAEQAAENAKENLSLYEVVWRERPITVTQRANLPRDAWIIFSEQTGLGVELLDEMRKHGISTVLCYPGKAFTSISPEEFQIDPRRESDYTRLLEQVFDHFHSLAGIVNLWAIADHHEKTPNWESASFGSLSTLYLLKALSFSSAGAGARLVVATRGCQLVNGTGLIDPAPAAIWGLLKTAPVENALLPIACVDLDPSSSSNMQDLFQETFSDAGDLEVAYRDHRRFTRRITQSRNAGDACGMPLRQDGVYVITGGTGSLGLQVAGFLASRGARHLALMSRNANGFAEHPAVKKIREQGCAVITAAVDVSDGNAMDQAMASIRAAGPPIRGVIHAAGIREDGALLDMSLESLDRVGAAKIKGAWNLHQSTATDQLDWFVLFSSAAGVLGSPGQANYSAANAFLDSLAHYRHSQKLPALSIDWGPWGGEGMASGMGESGEAHKLRTAASVIEPDHGLSLLGRVLQSKKVQLVALPFDLTHLLQFYPAKSGMSFFEELATPEIRMLKSTGTQRSVRPEIPTEYVQPRNTLERRITAIWQRSLAIEPVGVLDSFFELGGDSVFAHQMIVEVNRSLGVAIEPQEAFENLTISHLAELAQKQAIQALQSMTEADAADLLAQNAASISS